MAQHCLCPSVGCSENKCSSYTQETASVMLSCLNGTSGEEDGGTVVQVMLCRSQ